MPPHQPRYPASRVPRRQQRRLVGETQADARRSPDFRAPWGREIVDEMIDDYVTWREACAAVAGSYENWRCSDPPDEKLAFGVYVAALDREERAAAASQRAVG